MLPLGPGKRTGIALVVITVHFLSSGCADESSAHVELAEAVAVGREASGLLERVARYCGPTAEASAPAGECHPGVTRGPAGASFYAGEHEIEFRFVSDDVDVEYRSEAWDGVREVALGGRVNVGGRPQRVSLWSLAVARRGDAFEEVEVATRARIEGDDRLIELDEVRYRLRERGVESFYRTYWDCWRTAAGTFELEDGLFEGHRSLSGAWHLAAEGVVRRDGVGFGDVELGGPRDARRAVVVTAEGAIEL